MKRYWFTLLDEDYNDVDAFIPDRPNKQSAINNATILIKNNGYDYR